MKKILVVVLSCSVVSGCAWQSDAIQIGQDTYHVSANASLVRGGVTGAQEMALENASDKCQSIGRQIEVVDIKTSYAFPTNGAANITFKCVNRYQSSPDRQ